MTTKVHKSRRKLLKVNIRYGKWKKVKITYKFTFQRSLKASLVHMKVTHGLSAQHGRAFNKLQHARVSSAGFRQNKVVYSKIRDFVAGKNMTRVQLAERRTSRSFQAMDLAESCLKDTQTPSDAEVMHRSSQHDAGVTLYTRFHKARRGDHRIEFGSSLTVRSALTGWTLTSRPSRRKSRGRIKMHQHPQMHSAHK